MTTIKRGTEAEPFEDALKRAHIKVMCGEKYHAGMSRDELEKRNRDLNHYIRLKKIDRIISDAYCVRDGGTIHTGK